MLYTHTHSITQRMKSRVTCNLRAQLFQSCMSICARTHEIICTTFTCMYTHLKMCLHMYKQKNMQTYVHILSVQHLLRHGMCMYMYMVLAMHKQAQYYTIVMYRSYICTCAPSYIHAHACIHVYLYVERV